MTVDVIEVGPRSIYLRIFGKDAGLGARTLSRAVNALLSAEATQLELLTLDNFTSTAPESRLDSF